MFARNFFGPHAGARRQAADGQVRGIFSRRRQLAYLAASALVIVTSLGEASNSEAQGLLRRLENRIRSRVQERLQQPPPIDQAPVNPRRPGEGSAGRSESPRRPTVRSARPPYDAARPSEPSNDAAGEPSLGIEAVQHRGPRPGLEVVEFSPHSLADEAGIRIGDVIVAVGGVPTVTAAAVSRQLRQREIGASARLRVVRRGVPRDLSVPLVSSLDPAAADASQESRPNPRQTNPRQNNPRQTDPPRPAPPRLEEVPAIEPPAARSDDWVQRPRERSAGARAAQPDRGSEAPADSTEKARIGAQWADVEGDHGARIRSVAERSPAEVAGLQPGDRVVSVQGEVVTDPETLNQAIARRRPGDELVLQWVRGNDLIEASVTLAGPDGLARTDDSSSVETRGEKEAAEKGSMVQDVGSMLGKFFSGDKSSGSTAEPEPSSEHAQSPDRQPTAEGEPTSPGEPTGESGVPHDQPATKAPQLPPQKPQPSRSGTDVERTSDQRLPAPVESSESRLDREETEPRERTPQKTSRRLQPLDDRDPPSLDQVDPPDASSVAGSDSRSERVGTATGSDTPASEQKQQETVKRLRAEIERLKRRIERLENR